MTTRYLYRWAAVATVAALLLAGAIVGVTLAVSRNACTDNGGTLYGLTCFHPIPVEQWKRYSPGDSL